MIASLALWFAGHLLFRQFDAAPVWSSFDWRAALLAAFSAWLLLRLKWGVLPVLGVAASTGLLLAQF